VTKAFHVVPGQEASATQYFVQHLGADWATAMDEAYNLAASLLLPILKGTVT
jgi:hypothetical protein